MRSVCILLVVSTPVLLALLGCGSGQRKWEVTVENKAEAPCSFFVTLGPDGTSKAKVEDLANGKAISLIMGDTKTVVQTVRVVRSKDEQTLTPNVELPVGRRYAIVVGTDGKVEASVSDR